MSAYRAVAATPPGRALRRAWRLPALVGMLLLGLAIVLLAFPLCTQALRDRVVAWWSRNLLAASGVRLTLSQGPGANVLADPRGGAMVVANHVSWLDIFVIDALHPASFVAKADIARWPLVGLLVARVGTLFLERGRRHAVRDAIHRLRALFERSRIVAVFPEGTVSDGARLLPFHANLIEAAVESGVPVVPVALRYTDDGIVRSDAVFYVGDVGFVESVWRVTGAPRVHARVDVLEPVPTVGLTRHEVAARCREAISRCLDVPLEDKVPERVRGPRAAHR